MSHTLRLRLGARTDTGRIRSHNEDNFVLGADPARKVWNQFTDDVFDQGALGVVLMVADGMGGMEAGEHASAIAVAAIEAHFGTLDVVPPTHEEIDVYVRDALHVAHQAIVDDTQQHPTRTGMGTTAVLAWVVGDYAYLGWSGDSRAYLLTPEKDLVLLTVDHSLVFEMVRDGLLNLEEARTHPNSNVITQSLGDVVQAPLPDLSRVRLAPGARLLLCSDGLHGMLSASELQTILAEEAPPSQICTRLVAAANQAGGDDNITVILLDIVEDDEGWRSASTSLQVTLP